MQYPCCSFTQIVCFSYLTTLVLLVTVRIAGMHALQCSAYFISCLGAECWLVGHPANYHVLHLKALLLSNFWACSPLYALCGYHHAPAS